MTDDEAGIYSFELYKGQPFRRAFRRLTLGAPTDWTGYSGLCQLRTKPGADVVATATVSFDADRTTGFYYLDMTEAEIELLKTGAVLAYDVRMTKTGSPPIYTTKGTATVNSRVSIPTP